MQGNRPLAWLPLLIERALAGTAALWPEVEQGFVHAVARLLANAGEETGTKGWRRFDSLLAAMPRHRHRMGSHGASIDHFRELAQAYRPGLLHAADMPDLPRTNNALEQLFGSQRYHARRAIGRKTASPGAVLRGSVRRVADIATRAEPLARRDLSRVDVARCQALRRSTDHGRQIRTARTRFRRDPDADLNALEQQGNQSALPT